MELARDAALAPFKARVEHRQNYTTVLQGTYLWGASSELQQAAKQAVKEELEKLPPGCNRWEMEQARNRALAPFEAAIKASRTADHYLSYVDNYIEKVGDEEEGEWDLGDHWERRKYAEKLKKKLRPILIDKLFKEQLDEDDAYEFIEKWVDERLEAEEE